MTTSDKQIQVIWEKNKTGGEGDRQNSIYVITLEKTPNEFVIFWIEA